MDQKGFAPIATILIIAVGLILGGGIYLFLKNKVASTTVQSANLFTSVVLNNTTIENNTNAATCNTNGVYPDPQCTPGAVFSNVTATDTCATGYMSSVGAPSATTRNRVYTEYGIASYNIGQYQIDHFIPLKLGGSNNISNLWPQPAVPTPGFLEKDQVATYLYDRVCSGKLTLAQAQQNISTDWLEIYKSVFGNTTSVVPVSPSAATLSNTSTQNAAVPVGATVECNDGIYGFGQYSTTCSKHGGVMKWLY